MRLDSGHAEAWNHYPVTGRNRSVIVGPSRARRFAINVPRLLLTTGVAALLVASGLVAPTALAAPADWTAPKRIPGTAGLANPISATASNGTDLVVWAVGGSLPTENVVHARVRLAGRSQWRNVQVRLRGSFLQDIVIAPTPGGDFWAAYQRNVTGGGQQVFVTKLSSTSRRWSTPRMMFTEQDANYHAGPDLALAGTGALVVSAYAPPKDPPPGEPVYRVAVGTHSPGGRWRTRFLSPIDEHSGGQHLAVNAAGDIAVSFIQGYHLADMTVRAATKAHGRKATCKIGTLSDAGDSQWARVAIGDDGTAVVLWTATSTSFNAVRMATREVRRRLAPWVGRDVITGVTVAADAYGVVTPDGQVTAVWRQSGGGTTALWSRHLAGNTLRSPLKLTPNGEIAEFDALSQRPDGKAALFYQRFTPAIDSLGLQFRTLTHGVPGPVQVLTGDEATDGNANSEFLGVDAASRGTVIYTRGDYPGTDFAWQSQTRGKPSVMTGPASGVKVRRARVSGKARVGRVVSCQSGYWVEKSRLVYRWFRRDDQIPGAARRHKVVAADSGKSLRCVIVASNASGQNLRLTSKPRDVA